MTSFVSILLVLSVSTAPDGGFSHEVPTGPHTTEAVQSVETSLSRRTQHNIQSFQTLANDITKRIEFVKHVNDVVETLDAIRSSDTAQAVLDKIPGAEWIQMGLDKLSGMVRTIEGIRYHLTEMQSTSTKMSKALTEYFNQNKGDPIALQKLLHDMEEAVPNYRRAARAFKDTEEFLKGVDSVLKQSASTIGKAADIPIIGRAARPARDKLNQISAGIEVANAILKSARGAIDRHESECRSLQHTLANGLAQDTYNDGELNLEQHRHGTALIRYYQVRTNWPDTTWSHRSDRRIVDTIASLDRLALEKKQLEARVTHLEESVTTLSQQVVQEKERHEQTQDSLSSKKQQVMWMSIAMLILVIIGSGLSIVRRRRLRESFDSTDEQP